MIAPPRSFGLQFLRRRLRVHLCHLCDPDLPGGEGEEVGVHLMGVGAVGEPENEGGGGRMTLLSDDPYYAIKIYE